MPSTSTDRLYGMTTSVAVKPPCRVATTGPITASGEQTINSVAVVTGDRVLRKDEVDTTLNGIWVVDTSAWSRAPDFDGSLDAVNGTLVLVQSPNVEDAFYTLTATNPVIIGTSALVFTPLGVVADASEITYNPAGAGAVATTVQAKLRESVSVTDFGAVGDFNPATGVGTDSRAAIQAAFDYACSVGTGVEVIFPPGQYYLGTGYNVRAQVILGGYTEGSARNVTLTGYGASLYQGVAGKLLGVFGADNVTISGLKFICYVGGVINSSREHDAGIAINYKSNNVVIDGCYITNSLGDCVYIGGSLVSGGELGYECTGIVIKNSILKERFGDGIRSFSGGTRSRLAVAIIDGVNIKIHDNVIYGGVDLEINLNGQHSVGISVNNNKFRSGNVTAQSSIGSSYWYDEPLNLTGGSVISQYVALQGVPALPIGGGNVVDGNEFEYGYISHYNVYRFDSIANNIFVAGQIISGNTSGSNSTSSVYIANNIAYSPLIGETSFIKLSGLHVYGSFSGNRACGSSFLYCIKDDGASTGDGGRCVFINNTISTGTAVLGLTLLAASTESGSVNNGGTNNPSKFSYLKTDAIHTTMATVAIVAGAQIIDWRLNRSNILFLSAPAGVACSITDITSSPGDGTVIVILSGVSGGGGALTMTQGKFFNKGGISAVLAGTQVISYVSRAGFWFELSRGF